MNSDICNNCFQEVEFCVCDEGVMDEEYLAAHPVEEDQEFMLDFDPIEFQREMGSYYKTLKKYNL